MERKEKIKQKLLRFMIKYKIVSTLIPFIQFDDDFNYVINKNNNKIFFLEEYEKQLFLDIKEISFEEYNKFYYKWLNVQLEIIKTKRRNKEVITEDINEIDVFNEVQ